MSQGSQEKKIEQKHIRARDSENVSAPVPSSSLLHQTVIRHKATFSLLCFFSLKQMFLKVKGQAPSRP